MITILLNSEPDPNGRGEENISERYMARPAPPLTDNNLSSYKVESLVHIYCWWFEHNMPRR